MKSFRSWRLQLRMIDGYRCLIVDQRPPTSTGILFRVTKQVYEFLKGVGVKELKPAQHGIFKRRFQK